MKPHAAIAFLAVLVHALTVQHDPQQSKPPSYLRLIGSMVLGFSLPMLAMALYIWSIGALWSFLDIAVNYWPLFGALDGQHQTMFGWRRIENLDRGFRQLGLNGLWLLPVGLGFYVSQFRSTLSVRLKQCVLLLVYLEIAFAVYPIFSGQFFRYHWLPFLYFGILLSSLCLADRAQECTKQEWAVPAFVLLAVFLLTIQPPPAFYNKEASKSRRVDEIASFLESNLVTQDVVQPLDWTGGAVHAMFLAKARLATPFIYDVQFYHHVSNPYIQELRRRFIRTMQSVRPRFIVDIYGNDKPWVSGRDTTRDFEELRAFVANNYKLRAEGDAYRIYEYANSVSPALR
jgi:hypothetical protein